MPDIPRVNNLVLTWLSGRLTVAGVPVQGYMSIDAEHTRERPPIKGGRRSGRPIGKPAGTYEAKPFTVKILVDEWELTIRPALTALGLGSYGDAVFPVSFLADEPLNPQLASVVIWDGCTVDGEKMSTAVDSNDGLAWDITFGPMGMTPNGQFLYSLARDLTP